MPKKRKGTILFILYEPDEESILKDLLTNENVAIQIFKILLESNAGEQGAQHGSDG